MALYFRCLPTCDPIVFFFIFCSDDLEKYNQIQYTLISDDEEQLSIKDIQVLLVQALVYRLMVFAYEVRICFNLRLFTAVKVSCFLHCQVK